MRATMRKQRIQANISRGLADLARRAAHLDSRSLSSYVSHLIVKDLQAKGLVDEYGRPTRLPPGVRGGRPGGDGMGDRGKVPPI